MYVCMYVLLFLRAITTTHSATDTIFMAYVEAIKHVARLQNLHTEKNINEAMEKVRLQEQQVSNRKGLFLYS